jgi:ATP synthase protein I
MPQHDPQDSALAALSAQLEHARNSSKNTAKPPSQAAYAFRVGTELVSGVAVGFVIGYGLDAWLGSRPWMSLLFSIIGFAAGMRLMLDTAKRAGEEMQAAEEIQNRK